MPSLRTLLGVVCAVRATIVAETRRLLTDPTHYARMAQGGSPYGDGKSAGRIAAVKTTGFRGASTRCMK